MWANSLEIKPVLFQEMSWIRTELLVGVISLGTFTQPQPSSFPGSMRSLRCLCLTRAWSVHGEVLQRKFPSGETPPAMRSRASWCLQAMQECSADRGLGGAGPSAAWWQARWVWYRPAFRRCLNVFLLALSSWVPSRKGKALDSLRCSTARCHRWQLLQQQIGFYQIDAF